MSHEGKLKRGEAYNKMRIDGKLAAGVANNPSKMADLEYYLNSLKETEPKKKKGE